jgi:hypothetical protein
MSPGLSTYSSNPPMPGGFGGTGHTPEPSLRNRSAGSIAVSRRLRRAESWVPPWISKATAIPREDRPNNNLSPACSSTTLS